MPIPADPTVALFSHLPSAVESAPLLNLFLKAIALVESRRGENNLPRFEPAYMPKGFSVTVQGRVLTGTGASFNEIVSTRWNKFSLPQIADQEFDPAGPMAGCTMGNAIATAGSYSPWQILFHTAADRGFKDHPCRLWEELEAKKWVCLELDRLWNRFSKRMAGAVPVARIARAWNGGEGGAEMSWTVEYGEKFGKAWADLLRK